MPYEDSYLDTSYEDRTELPYDDRDYDDDEDREDRDEDQAEYDRDVILAQQELEDYENCPYDDGNDADYE